MSKVKNTPEDRTYDSDGFWLRAACVCTRDDSEAEILLVSSSARPDRWIIPGGKVQPGEEPENGAVREVMEEAGVVGYLGRYLGVFENPERKHRTRVFVLRVCEMLEVYEDKGMRKREWFAVEEAKRLLAIYKPLHCKYLSAMRHLAIQQQQQQPPKD